MNYLTSCVFCVFLNFLPLCINMSSCRDWKGHIGALMDNVKWIT